MGKEDTTIIPRPSSKSKRKGSMQTEVRQHEPSSAHHVHFDTQTILIPRITFSGEDTINNEDNIDDDQFPDYDAKDRFRRRTNSDCHKVKEAMSKRLNRKKTETTKTYTKVPTEHSEVAKLGSSSPVDYDQMYKDLETVEHITIVNDDVTVDNDIDDEYRPRAYSEGAKMKSPLKSILKYRRPAASCIVVVHKD